MSDLLLALAFMDVVQTALLLALAFKLYVPSLPPVTTPSPEVTETARALVRAHLGKGRERLRARLDAKAEKKEARSGA